MKIEMRFILGTACIFSSIAGVSACAAAPPPGSPESAAIPANGGARETAAAEGETAGGKETSCEEAGSRYVEEFDSGKYKELGDPEEALRGMSAAHSAVLNKGTYLNQCGVPVAMEVSICAAVQQGKVMGVTVKTSPGDAGIASCIARKIRAFRFQPHWPMVLAKTTFAADAPDQAASPTPGASPSASPATPSTPTTPGRAEFDRTAAKKALAAAFSIAQKCETGGLRGSAHVLVVFEPSGHISSARVDSPPFAGTKAGDCITSSFQGLTVPAFNGAPVTVGHSIRFE